MPGGRPFINLPNPTGPGVISTQLSVPSTKCGIVIGKSKYRFVVNIMYIILYTRILSKYVAILKIFSKI